MDIGETAKQANEFSHNLGLYSLLASLSLLTIYAIRRELSKPKKDYISLYQEETQQESTDEDYPPSSISDAIRSCEDSKIKGVIKEFHKLPTGYSGVITDSYDAVPFHLDEDNIATNREEGLVPILLNHSRDTKTSITLKGNFEEDTKVFGVVWLEYKMNNVNYVI